MDKKISREIELLKPNSKHKFTHVLIIEKLKLFDGKEYLMDSESLLENKEEMEKKYNITAYETSRKLEKEEEFILDFIKEDFNKSGKDIQSLKKDINISYTGFPLYWDIENINKGLEVRKVAIAEVKSEYEIENIKTYIFSDVKEYLELVDKFTLRC